MDGVPRGEIFVRLGVRPKTGTLVGLGAVLLLTLATRLPFIPEHLYSFDSVNLALALQEFSPSRHQPQPPGYPLFVAEARLIYRLVGTPERTFTIIKILISSLSVMLLYLLGKRMFSGWVGISAAGLFFVNPVFWYAGLTSSLRLHLALLSIVAAYFCWRASSGEPRYLYAASCVVGLGSGFRPELLLFLLPLWLWTAGHCRSKRLFVAGLLLLLIGTLSWVFPLVVVYGGWEPMISSFREYVLEQSQSAMALAGTGVEWRRMVGRAFLWNGLGVLPWIWTIPLTWRYRNRFSDWKRQLLFLALWFFPPFFFHLLVHIGAPGHALVSIPALCLVGGLCTIEAQGILTDRHAARSNPIGPVIWLALAGNAILFCWPYAMPQRKEVTAFRGWASIRDAVTVGTFETSLRRARYVEETTKMALEQIEVLTSDSDRPVVLVWNRDAVPVWRKVAYYAPCQPLYETAGRRTQQPRARVWVGTKMVTALSGSPSAKLPVPKKGRVIWLVHPDALSDLAQAVPLWGAFPAYYTDLDEDSVPFDWGSFEFIPDERWDARHNLRCWPAP